MKIEFNSVEELTSFIKTFKMEDPGTVSPESIKDLVTFRPELPAEFDTARNIEKKALETVKPEIKDMEIKITKEMLRERVTAIMSAGKGEQIRALIAQHGANSVTEIKVEDYPVIYSAAQGLL